MTDPDRPELDFGVLLAMAYAVFVDRLHTHMAEAGHAGYNTRVGFVIRVLEGGPLSLRELADRLEMSSPAALKIIDPMVEEGYVARIQSPEDRRVRSIVLTERGHAALADARRLHAILEEEIVAELGAHEAASVRRGLTVVASHDIQVIPRVLRRPAGQ